MESLSPRVLVASGNGLSLLPLGLTLATWSLAGPIRPGPAQAQAMTIPLQCRLGAGSWQPCQMEVIELGSRWVLEVGNQRLEFVHDGRGAVSMQAGSGSWRSVSSRWERAQDLCWDGICTRGAIPLD